jgi:hypothetical protein
MERRRRRAIQWEEHRKRVAELLSKHVDTVVSLEAMAVLQEVMAHFYFKAKALKSMGADAPIEEIDDAMDRAGKWADKLAAYKYAKIQAMRLASDPNAPVLPEQMTLEELRLSIMGDIERLREMKVLTLPHEVNAQNDAVRYNALPNEPPQGNQKLARQGHDHGLAGAAGVLGAGPKPLRQG